MKKLSVVFALLTALSLFVAGFSAYGLLFRRQPAASVSPAVVRPVVVTAPAITVSVDTLYEVLEPCTELVTATDRYTNRGTVSDHRELFGRTVSCTIEEVEFSYIGTLRAGIDLSKVKFEVNDASRVIYVTLPAPTVISHSIDTSSFFLPDQAQRSFHGDLSGRVHRGARLHLLRAGGRRNQVRQGFPPCVGDRRADCHRSAQGGIRHCRLHAPLLHRILTHGQPLGAAFLRIRLGMCKIMHILFLTIYL